MMEFILFLEQNYWLLIILLLISFFFQFFLFFTHLEKIESSPLGENKFQEEFFRPAPQKDPLQQKEGFYEEDTIENELQKINKSEVFLSTENKR